MLKEQLLECHQRIKPYIHNTPVLTSRLINQEIGTKLYFKCENFQKMGAFKIRGATNAVLQLSDEQKSRGVITHSSGNFAQGLALAAQSIGIAATIVMPNSVPEVKKKAVLGYGGKIVLCEPTLKDRENTARKIQQNTGATYIHPSNDMDVILGQGTACLELLNAQPDLDIVIVPVGGGGLLAGTSIAAHHFGNNCVTLAGEPFEVDDAYRSLKSGKLESNKDEAKTIADGLNTQLGDINFPIILKYVDGILRVTEQEIVDAMGLIWERMKIIIETSSAVPFAAILKDKELFKDKKIGVIISGGNVDLSNLPFR